MTELAAVLGRIDGELDNLIGRLFELVRIPSISTDPAYARHCDTAARWLANNLKSIGFSAKVVKTKGRPMVVAQHRKAGKAPHVLFYGHYDVQPVDPLELWDSPPFEPKIAGNAANRHLLGRGTSDDKGQLMTFVEACRAYKAETGKLPLNITILLEGEEESGSQSLVPFLKAYKKELKADFALVCDTGMWDRRTPTITTALRGLVGEEVTIHAANRDLHSGMYGSAAANPIRILSRILAGLHDQDGRVTLPGFYEGVPETPPDVLAQWEKLTGTERKYLKSVGLSLPAGEKGRSILEMIWARPTAEINGIIGGYTGDGFKTVIPAVASAKVSFRLVGDQDPKKIRAAFRNYVKSALPKDCKASFAEHGAGPAIRLDYSMPALAKAAAALNDEWGRPAVLAAMGGSIPVVGHFQTLLGMQSLLVGYALEDDRIHSPNEKYDLASFHRGARSWARILAALAA